MTFNFIVETPNVFFGEKNRASGAGTPEARGAPVDPVELG
jgi:hypothetical protein